MFKTKIHVALFACCGVAMLPSVAHATPLTMESNTATFNLSNSVTRTQDGSTVTANTSFSTPTTLGSSVLSQFDRNKGVLVGVNVKSSADYTQTTNVVAGSGAGNAGTSYTAKGTGASEIALKIPTNVVSSSAQATASAQSIQDSCTGGNKNNCGDGVTSNTLTNTINVDSPNLNAYVGSGNVTVDQIAKKNQATFNNSGNFEKPVSVTSTLTWAGSVFAEYSYLEHASASFNLITSQGTLDLDFGEMYVDETSSPLDFSISNLLGKLAGSRVDLSLTNIVGSGNTGVFWTDLAAFSNLAAGASNNYKASFLGGASAGEYAATYLLTLADVAPSVYASDTLFSGYNLTLNLKGTLVDRPAVPGDVPEPASLALLGLGALAAAAGRKRRKN